jgi:hypothetical protein
MIISRHNNKIGPVKAGKEIIVEYNHIYIQLNISFWVFKARKIRNII